MFSFMYTIFTFKGIRKNRKITVRAKSCKYPPRFVYFTVCFVNDEDLWHSDTTYSEEPHLPPKNAHSYGMLFVWEINKHLLLLEGQKVKQNKTAADKKSHVGLKSNILQMYIHAVIVVFPLEVGFQ